MYPLPSVACLGGKKIIEVCLERFENTIVALEDIARMCIDYPYLSQLLFKHKSEEGDYNPLQLYGIIVFLNKLRKMYKTLSKKIDTTFNIECLFNIYVGV